MEQHWAAALPLMCSGDCFCCPSLLPVELSEQGWGVQPGAVQQSLCFGSPLSPAELLWGKGERKNQKHDLTNQ